MTAILSLVWALFRPVAPYLAAMALLWAGWTYLQSLRAAIVQQQAEIAAEQAEKSQAQAEATQLKAHVRTRIDAERKARENEIEIAKHLRKARAAAAVDADRLRDYRTKPAAAMPASAADQPADTRTCEPAGPARGSVDEDRAREIEQACALTSRRHKVLRDYVLELNRQLTEAQGRD